MQDKYLPHNPLKTEPAKTIASEKREIIFTFCQQTFVIKVVLGWIYHYLHKHTADCVSPN